MVSSGQPWIVVARPVYYGTHTAYAGLRREETLADGSGPESCAQAWEASVARSGSYQRASVYPSILNYEEGRGRGRALCLFLDRLET